MSNGKSYLPQSACTLKTTANLGDVSMVSSKERGVGGADWTRTIVHWKGHYFTVLDRMEARPDDQASSASDPAAASEFAFVCRWRSLQQASMVNGVWTAASSSGNVMRIQSAQDVFQTSTAEACDGSASPFVLRQYKQAKLAKGQAQTFQNLLFVSGPNRPDEFEARQAGPQAMLVKGKIKGPEHLALIGTDGEIPLGDFQTDAAIYDVTADTLRLAGVTTLRANVGKSNQEVF